MKYIIHTDGGARGNPGPAAIGVVIVADGKIIASFGKRIGETTNNVSEYMAVIEAMKWLRNYPILKLSNSQIIQFFLDSNLVVQQLNGKFKVKNNRLRELLMKIKILEQEVRGVISYNYVRREQNKNADFLVNQALDRMPHVSLL